MKNETKKILTEDLIKELLSRNILLIGNLYNIDDIIQEAIFVDEKITKKQALELINKYKNKNIGCDFARDDLQQLIMMNI